MLHIPWNGEYVPHSPTPRQLAFLMLPHREALFGGAAGGGKVLYEDGLILTPHGFKKCTDLKVGSLINAVDGSVSRVSWLHPWNEYQVWRVHFHDGTSTDVAEEHLWLAWRSDKRKKVSGKAKFGLNAGEVISTRELRTWLEDAVLQESSGLRPNWPCIPICAPQPFNTTSRNGLTVDPYLLGMLIGDGYLSKNAISITSQDHEHLEAYLHDFSYSRDTSKVSEANAYRFTGESFQKLRDDLKLLKLLGTRSSDKFIPRKYLQSSIENRLSLLQGLMDTDGFVDDRGQLYYCTISEQLKQDVMFLVQSLGGTATPTWKDTYSGGAWDIYIKLPDETKAFRLPRKLSRCQKGGCTYRRVVDVEKLSIRKRGRCITVSHPSGLYMTNDFIVTHNSDALLMAATQYVHVPGYAALILRRTLTDLKQPEALLDRSSSWFSGKKATYYAEEHAWKFPTRLPDGRPGKPAVIQFGFIGDSTAKNRYQGAEYQFVGFDELTQHKVGDYTYLFSRQRATRCPYHTDATTGVLSFHEDCEDCLVNKGLQQVPLRMRATANPGGTGHAWVKKRYNILPDKDPIKARQAGVRVRWVGKNPNRPFIPSFVQDNPFISQEDYIRGLQELDPVERAQLLMGDWGATHDARFSMDAVGFYRVNGDFFMLGSKAISYKDLLQVFCTIDPATTSREGPTQLVTSPDKEPSKTAMSAWGLTPDMNLLLLETVRGCWEAPEVVETMVAFYKKWKPRRFVCENNGPGKPIHQFAARRGLPISTVHKTRDKVSNSFNAQLRLRQGRLWLPEAPSQWKEDFIDEVFTWTGASDQDDDIVDTLSDACNFVDWDMTAHEMEDADDMLYSQSAPFHISMGLTNPFSSRDFM